MEVFGISIDILDLMFYFCIVLVGYFVLLELEFRELRNLTRSFDNEENQFEKEIRELKEEITNLTKIIESR